MRRRVPLVRGAAMALVLVATAGACAAGSPEAGSASSSPSAAASAPAPATPSPTPLPSATLVAPTILVTASPARTAAPPAPAAAPSAAPTQAPPPPAPASAPTVKAVPAVGSRGTTFVFQLAGFPANVDMVMTVTGPDGKASAPVTVPIGGNGAGLATYATKLADPTGPYIAVFRNGGVVVQVVFQLM